MQIELQQVHIPEHVKRDIARRAGVKGGRINVVFYHDEDGADRPPTLTRIRNSQRRLVMVGKEWLRKKAPALWAQIVAARLLGKKETITVVDGGDHLEAYTTRDVQLAASRVGIRVVPPRREK